MRVTVLGDLLASLVAQTVKRLSACNVGDLGSAPGSGRSPGEGKWQPTPVLLPGESHGGRSLVGYNSPWDAKSGTRLSDLPFTFSKTMPVYQGRRT